MKLLVIDGNSILNRAYYGVRLLSTKDGRFTNGIYGFLNIMYKVGQLVKVDYDGDLFEGEIQRVDTLSKSIPHYDIKSLDCGTYHGIPESCIIC